MPSPPAMRLLSAGGRPPKAPFGLAGWTDTAQAIAVLIEVLQEGSVAAQGDVATIATIARQVPDASTIAPGTLVVVLGDAAAAPGLLARWRRPPRVHRALRGSALLARGYRGIAGGVDPASGLDLIWGFASDY